MNRLIGLIMVVVGVAALLGAALGLKLPWSWSKGGTSGYLLGRPPAQRATPPSSKLGNTNPSPQPSNGASPEPTNPPTQTESGTSDVSAPPAMW